MTNDRPVNILILGGGFGGIYAAVELEKLLADRPSTKITLVNRENFFLFTPMLHEIAASDLDITDIVNPIRQLLHRTEFFVGEVDTIDLQSKKVLVSHGSNHVHTLEYDYLLIALGSVTNFYNLPGLEENALTMKSLGDAIYLRNHLIANLEAANFECSDENERKKYLTLVIAGGGFAGVETIAAVNDFWRESVKYYPNLREEWLKVVLVNDLPSILLELKDELGVYAQQKLRENNVDVMLGVRISGYRNGVVEMADGTSIATNTLVWTAGVTPGPMITSLPCKAERGRLIVNEYMEVVEHPGVWSVGDCAAVPDAKTGKFCPPTAQHAMRQGKLVAHNITASINGTKQKSFDYQTMGQMAALGRRTAVAQVMGMTISGLIAWLMWRMIYIAKLPGLDRKVRVMLGWALDLIFPKDLVQFMTDRSRAVSKAEEQT